MTPPPTHVVVGPPRHGVVTFALALAESIDRLNRPAPVIRVADWTELESALQRFDPSGGVHLNFTDRLFGATPADAAERVVALVHLLDAAGAGVTATLHDVPQAVDGGNYRQRIDAYRTVCAALRGRATNSEHERSLLHESAIAEPADVIVVPLPLHVDEQYLRPIAGGSPSVAVLGFVYPGKGHHEVIAAMTHAPPDAEFLAIGECSTGHEDLADELAGAARAAGRRFTLTGYVASERLSAVLHGVTVPVAHHRHVSASGSLNTWIGAHRRPLVPINRYTIEHDRRHPGTVQLYPDTAEGLATAIETAFAAPDSTWLAEGVGSGAPPAETARRYAEALAAWHG